MAAEIEAAGDAAGRCCRAAASARTKMCISRGGVPTAALVDAVVSARRPDLLGELYTPATAAAARRRLATLPAPPNMKTPARKPVSSRWRANYLAVAADWVCRSSCGAAVSRAGPVIPLRRCRRPQGLTGRMSEPEPPVPGGRRVMIVDDDVRVRNALRALIEATADHAVVGEASDAVHALDVVHRYHPDLRAPPHAGLGCSSTRACPRTSHQRAGHGRARVTGRVAGRGGVRNGPVGGSPGHAAPSPRAR